ncbi:hypothetical protein [Methylorubrum extorquens]
MAIEVLGHVTDCAVVLVRNLNQQYLVSTLEEWHRVRERATGLSGVLPSHDDPSCCKCFDPRRNDEHRSPELQDGFPGLDVRTPVLVTLVVIAAQNDEIGCSCLLRQEGHKIQAGSPPFNTLAWAADPPKVRFNVGQLLIQASSGRVDGILVDVGAVAIDVPGQSLTCGDADEVGIKSLG